MSNTYFVKYLPVEGDIKEGSFIYEKSLSDETIFQVYKRNDELVFFRFRNVPIKISKAGNIKLVEPFLCSSDVKVGDKVMYNGNDYPTGVLTDEPISSTLKREFGYNSKYVQWDKGHKNLTSLDGLIKVIGKISPEAWSYIKDGDVLTEESVKVTYKDGFGCRINKYTYDSMLSHPEIYGKPSVIIQIKGPCSHFH